MSAAPLSVPAVFEGGAVRLLVPAPFADGVELTVALAGRAGETLDPRGGSNLPQSGPPQRDVSPGGVSNMEEQTPGAGEFPPLDPEDPLLRLSGLTIDGPPDGSRHVDDYKLGLKKWPPA